MLALFEHGLVMTASAIGDNLVKKSFLLTYWLETQQEFPRTAWFATKGIAAKLQITCQNTLQQLLLQRENRSVWIAQREGRTKDGNDATHPGRFENASDGFG